MANDQKRKKEVYVNMIINSFFILVIFHVRALALENANAKFKKNLEF